MRCQCFYSAVMANSKLDYYLYLTCNLQPATCTCNLQPATCNLQPATCNLQPATCNLQPATCKLHPPRIARVWASPFAKKTKIWRPFCYVVLFLQCYAPSGQNRTKKSWKWNHQDLDIYRQLINFLRHVDKGQNLLFIMPRFRVTSTLPWIVSAAIKSKWTRSILLPIVYFGLWNKINLRFSRVCLLWMATMQT